MQADPYFHINKNYSRIFHPYVTTLLIIYLFWLSSLCCSDLLLLTYPDKFFELQILRNFSPGCIKHMVPIFVKTFEIGVRTGMLRFGYTNPFTWRYISICYKYDSVVAVSISILKTLLFHREIDSWCLSPYPVRI